MNKKENPNFQWDSSKCLYLAVADDNYPLGLYNSRSEAEADRPGCLVHKLFAPRPKNTRWFEEPAVTGYWQEHYLTQDGSAHCTLCGNTGVIDTTGKTTPAGQPVGRKNWCVCPNGQLKRVQLDE